MDHVFRGRMSITALSGSVLGVRFNTFSGCMLNLLHRRGVDGACWLPIISFAAIQFQFDGKRRVGYVKLPAVLPTLRTAKLSGLPQLPFLARLSVLFMVLTVGRITSPAQP